MRVKNAQRVEAFVHDLLSKYRVRGEWFKLPEGQKTWTEAIRKYYTAIKAPRAIPLAEPAAGPFSKYNQEIQIALNKRSARYHILCNPTDGTRHNPAA